MRNGEARAPRQGLLLNVLETSENTTVATPTPAMGLLQDGEDEEAQGWCRKAGGEQGGHGSGLMAHGGARAPGLSQCPVGIWYLLRTTQKKDFCKVLAQIPGNLPPACHGAQKEQYT